MATHIQGLDFEKPVLELEKKVEELKNIAADKDLDLTGEISRIEEKLAKLKKEVYDNLTPWQRVQIARLS